MQLTEIPLNANGKTDDKRLPEPTIPERLYVRPANEREQLLCRTFAKVLQTDQVGATDNFFDLGGTSLSVMLLLGELEKAGIHLTYQEVFNNPTPRSLSTPRTPAPSCPPRPVCCDSVATHPALNKNEWGAAPFILTGATGFLGIHILHELITHDAQQVCCLVRDKDGIKAEERLRNRIRTYFGDESSMLSLLGSRIQVVCGDITSALSFNRLPFPPLSPSTDTAVKVSHAPSTLIHCAADVRYFAQGTAVEDTNIKGTENVIRFCLATGTRLIHISTTSLNVLHQEQQGRKLPAQLNTTMLEQLGITAQGLLSLPYLQSKRAAEELVLRAANEQLLDAHIIRIGSLMPRLSDGMFQVNAQDNLFMRLLNVIQQTGTCAASLADYPVVCAPVDVVAQAIVKGCYEVTPPIKWMDATPRPLREIIAERNGGDNRLRLVSDEEFLSLTQHST
jgi:thioester reductase-like protein/aryl carrier-like protein